MIKLTDRDGRVHHVAASAIARISEAGLSSRWHGTRAYVRTFDGDTLEVQEEVNAISSQVEAETQGGAQ